MSLQAYGHGHDRHEPLRHFPLRYWMSSSKALTAQIHTIIRTTISQYYVNQAVKRGVARLQIYFVSFKAKLINHLLLSLPV
jgi:hypothetical protein